MKTLSLFIISFLFSTVLLAQDLILTSPQFNDTLIGSAEINIEITSKDYHPGDPAHLNVINTESGYRKLKLGNNPTSIYSPKVNVSFDGNDKLRLVLRDVSGTADWSKIRFRPNATGSLSLKSYVDAIGGVGSEWTTLTIPLSDFDSSIDFSQLGFIEFPYSADASPFEIDIAKIEFIGGTSPYLWYGDNKTNNIHDGFGGAGQLVASSASAVEVNNTLESIELYINNNLIGSDSNYPFGFNIILNQIGENSIYAKALFNDNSYKVSDNYSVYIKEFTPLDLSIALSSPKNQDTATLNQIIKLKAEVAGAQPNQPAYLSVLNENSGFLKLKIGYDPFNIYAAGRNVIAGGNDKLRVTLKNNNGFNNWSQLRLRPIASGNLNLQKYVDAVGGIGSEWTTIEIPLSDFDSSIDFSNLNYMEFPYSADAGVFQLDIKEIIFTGGDHDFVWFGENKNDNSQDGNGGPGQLVAKIIPALSDENSIQKVEFLINGVFVGEDYFAPYAVDIIPKTEGVYIASAKVITQNQQTALSENISFVSLRPENPLSELKISFLEPNSGDSILVNQIINFIPFIEGEDLETDIYLKTWNSETGFRKLKFGYDDQYLYGQFQDVISGGNNTLEIILKSQTSHLNWSKIRIRPSALGSLSIDKYIAEDTADWILIKIPLSDFDASIDFTQLSFFEFPYSADAGAFEIDIKEVKFTGGTTPFEWFGPNHYNNIHDGIGASGNIFAQLQMPNLNPILTDSVYFIVNGLVQNYSTIAPFQFTYASSSEKTDEFTFKLIDSNGYSALSEPIDIKFYDIHSEDYAVLTLTFDQDPGDIQVSVAPLKYNKDFAYSFTLDDGKLDGYSYAFKLLNGGDVADTGESFDGLFYTDGCGNEIPFNASIAWNSVNSSFSDIHIDTPGYITWSNLQEMILAGWDVMNHSYSHSAYAETDYDFQIIENQKAVLEKTAYKMTQFVVPSGDLLYVEPAFKLEMQAVYSNKYEFLGFETGIDIDSPFNTFQPKIYRRYMYNDEFNVSNIMNKINEIAENSQNGNHLWWNDFTHRVIPEPTDGSLEWDTFKFYMQEIASKYGADGSDNIWFAPQVEILNYLKVRESTSLITEKTGNTVKIYLNTTDIPANFLDYFLSLNITADAELLSVSPQFSANVNFANSTSTEKLVNIEWSQPTMKRMRSVDISTSIDELNDSNIAIYPNPLNSPQLNIDINNSNTGNYELNLLNTVGQLVASQLFNGSTETNKLILNLPNLQSGVYFLSIELDGRLIKTEKVIVQ